MKTFHDDENELASALSGLSSAIRQVSGAPPDSDPGAGGADSDTDDSGSRRARGAPAGNKNARKPAAKRITGKGTIGVHLGTRLRARLHRDAEALEISVSDAVRQAVRQWCETVEQPHE